MDESKKVTLPQMGLFACFSGGSNTGSLTGMAALEAVRRLGDEMVGICSLPAMLNQVPRQSALVRKIKHIVVIDGCHNECARRLLEGVGIRPTVYLNLERDLGLRKAGPFTGLNFDDQEVGLVADAIVTACQALLNGSVQDAGRDHSR